MSISKTDSLEQIDAEVIDFELDLPMTKDIDSSGSEKSGSKKNHKSKKAAYRKLKSFRPIILIMLLALVGFSTELCAEFYGSIDLGLTYTDNAYQLSGYDLQRFEDGNPDLEFVNNSDDVVMNTMFYGAYLTQWHWWRIQPLLQCSVNQYILNPNKQRMSFLTGVKIFRRLGEIGFFYGYIPDNYIRSYIDTDGTDELEDFTYDRNLYRVDLKLKPLSKSTVGLDYRLEQYFYDEHFTEFDGDINTWTLSWQQSLPTFYLDAAYGYRVYETDNKEAINNPEDASYESNVYSFGLLMKKMSLDERYPSVQWRPEINLRFEERYYQGSDSWHAGRTDNINTTTGTIHFYFGPSWNINLDYSHLFRNVDAVYSSVRKYKEYSENRFGINARYSF